MWLKYDKVDNSKKLDDYQRAISAVVIQGQSETCEIIRQELEEGLSGLLAKDVPFTKSLNENNSLIIGTPSGSEIIKELSCLPSPDTLGDEGFIIKSVKIDGRDTIIIASNEDVGLLYGTFDLLRLMQTGQSLEDINIISKPRIQRRILNHWVGYTKPTRIAGQYFYFSFTGFN